MTTSTGEQRLHERMDEIKDLIAKNHTDIIEKIALKPCNVHQEQIKSLHTQMKWTWKGIVGGALAIIGLALKTLWAGPGAGN